MTPSELLECFSEEAMDAVWTKAMERIREAGEDPDEIVALAQENIQAWRAVPLDPSAFSEQQPDEVE